MEARHHFIEDARPSDIEDIAAFQVAHAREVEDLHLDHVLVSEGVAQVFVNHGLGFYLVARERSLLGSTQIIGTVLVTKEWSDWRARFFWWIQSLYVEPNHRRRGIAQALIARVHEKADEAGVAGLRLYVERHNAPAQELYAALGFREGGYTMLEKGIPHKAHDRGLEKGLIESGVHQELS